MKDTIDRLHWEAVDGDVILDDGGEGVRAWEDSVEFHCAEVPGGTLVMANRTGPNGVSTALTFVPEAKPQSVPWRFSDNTGTGKPGGL